MQQISAFNRPPASFSRAFGTRATFLRRCFPCTETSAWAAAGKRNTSRVVEPARNSQQIRPDNNQRRTFPAECGESAEKAARNTHNQRQVVEEVADDEDRVDGLQTGAGLLLGPPHLVGPQTRPPAVGRTHRRRDVGDVALLVVRQPVRVVVAELAQVRRGLLHVVERRHLRPVQVVADHQEARDGDDGEEDVQHYHEHVELHVQLEGHEPAGRAPQAVAVVVVVLRQDRRDADARAERRQAEQVVDHVRRREEAPQVLPLAVQLRGEHADDGERGQGARLEGVHGVEDPDDHAAVLRVDDAAVQEDDEGVAEHGEVAEDAHDEHGHDGDVVGGPALAVLVEDGDGPEEQDGDEGDGHDRRQLLPGVRQHGAEREEEQGFDTVFSLSIIVFFVPAHVKFNGTNGKKASY